MVLSIKSERADRLARDLAELTGQSITDAVVAALEARLELERRRRQGVDLTDIVDRFGRLDDLDVRQPDDIIGYDEVGLPT